MAKLTKDQVKHVAKLANLPLSPDEEQLYVEQLSKILDYVDQLNSVDTSNVEPTFNIGGQNTVWREDEPVASLSQDETLQNVLQKENGKFITKRVLGEK